jgi:hypothetical protein
VCHVLQDPAFFHFLTRIDEEFAAVTRLGRCPGCEGPLHVADYPRKPRGVRPRCGRVIPGASALPVAGATAARLRRRYGLQAAVCIWQWF